MIYCIGTLTALSGLEYTDPVINVYYLSYNADSGVITIPQILVNDSIVDQLTAFNIPAPGGNLADREQITELLCSFLNNEYTECEFFTNNPK